MKFMGSKRRIAKHIIPIMLKEFSNVRIFYDVFTGGGNLISEVPSNLIRIGIDIDKYAIAALRAIRDFPWKLPKNKEEFTEEDYYKIRDNKDLFPDYLVGYVGYALSWGGKWFGGWRRNKKVSDYDPVKEAYNSALRQHRKIKNAIFICSDYREIKYLKDSILYFDPPYMNTTRYKTSFDYKFFYEWLLEMGQEGYNIFLSEYSVPAEYEKFFKVVWRKKIDKGVKRIHTNKSEKGIEKLFKLVI